MAYIAQRKKELDKEYAMLERKLGGLIGYVAGKMLPNESEILYSNTVSLAENKETTSCDIEDRYVLTNEGLWSGTIIKEAGDKSFKPEKIEPLEMIMENRGMDEVFNQVCKNLQKIIDARRIDIPKEYRL